MYERVTESYVADPEIREFFRDPIPGRCALAERLLEAHTQDVASQRHSPQEPRRRGARGGRLGGAADMTGDTDTGAGRRDQPRPLPLQRRRRAGRGAHGAPAGGRRPRHRGRAAAGATRARQVDAARGLAGMLPGGPCSWSCRSAPPRTGSSAPSTSRPLTEGDTVFRPGLLASPTAASSTSTRSTCSPTTWSTCCWTWPGRASTSWSATASRTRTRPGSCWWGR